MKKTVLIKRIVLVLMVVGILSFAACSVDGGKIDIDQTITPTTSTHPQDSVPPQTTELEFALNEDGRSYYVKSLGRCTDSEFSIPDTYEGKPVTAIGEGAFRENANLTRVIIPKSVKEIGEYAFYGCVSLTEITIGENVLYIGNYAFYGCINITVINYNANGVYEFQENNNVFTNAGINGDGITLNIGVHVVGIPKNCFNPTGSVETAPNIKEINFEDGSNCEVIAEKAFYLCVNIKILIIPDSVQIIDHLAFYGCEGLQELTIGEGVTFIGPEAFSQCVNITVLNFNAIMIDEYSFGEGEKHPFTNISRDTDGAIVNIGVNVTVIPNNFFYTGDIDNPINVKEVNFADGSKCESIGQNAFFFCINITVFVIPDSVTNIGDYAFYGCWGIEELTIGDGVVSIGNSAFGECYNLTSLTIGENVKSIGDDAFFYCTNITIINFNAIWMNDLVENNNVFRDVGKEGKGITVNIGANVKVIPSNLFSGMSLIKEVNFADGSKCETIGYKAFYRCINMIVINIPAGIVSIGDYAFYGCTNLETIYYDAVNIANLPENAFKNAGKNGVTVIINITVIVIPESFFYNQSGENIFVDVKWDDGTKCEHPHVWSEWATTNEPSCTSTGLAERVCHCGEKQTNVISVKGHTEVIDDAVAPTCTETGLTVGKHCSVCNAVIIAQTVVPVNGHTEVIDDAVAPTCTETGLTEGKHCPGCGEVLVAQTVVAATGHTEVIDNAIAPTCTEIGLTEGKHCSVCGKVLVTQTVVAATGHSFSDWNILKEATLTEEGLKERTCRSCGTTQTESIPKLQLTGSEGLEFQLNSDSASYSVVGIGTCTDTDVVIPETYNGLPVTSIGYRAFYNCTSLTSIEIPNSVTTIGVASFSGCTLLTSIEIPDFVTSIGGNAFENCTSLVSIEIPDSVTSIGITAFNNCTSLTSAVIGDSVTSIAGWIFNNCTSLTSVVIGDSVTSIGNWAFYNCTSLTSIDIPNSVTSIGNSAFEMCTSLTSAVIGDSVTSIGWGVFSNCTSLTSVEIGDSVTSIGEDAFNNCTSLQYNEYDNALYLGNDNNPYFVLIKAKDRSITSCEIHNQTRMICYEAFYECTSLTSIIIPDSVTSIGNYALYGCTSLTSIEISDSVTSIGNSAFRGCTSLTSIKIPDLVTSIGSSAFSGCSSLESITLPFVGGSALATEASSSTLFGYVFGTSSYTGGTETIQYYGGGYNYTKYYIPTSLKSVTITGGNLYYGAFYNCTSLTNIEILDSVTSIGNSVFYNCKSLTSIEVDENNNYYKSIDGNLYSIDGQILLQYAIGKQESSFIIPDSVTKIGDGAFSYCRSLINIKIPDSVTIIGDGAFNSCGSLTSIEIPNSVTSIGNLAFCYCTSLTSIEIPGSVTSIGDKVFYVCTSLKSIEIPDSITSIGKEAFYVCESLTSINFGGTVKKWNAISKGSYWNHSTGSYTIYCTDGEISIGGKITYYD